MEEARGGTLVLEDIEALSHSMQARLLTATYNQGTPAETRIVAICNLQEQDQTCESVLRPDLFYRLAALRITVPPLRQRGEDILTLFTRLGEQFSEEYGCDAPEVSAQEAAQLLQAPWPGNVRQLRNVIERVLILGDGSGDIEAKELPGETEAPADDGRVVLSGTVATMPLREAREAFEREYLLTQINRFGGNISRTAEFVGMERSALHRKLKSLGVVTGNKTQLRSHPAEDYATAAS